MSRDALFDYRLSEASKAAISRWNEVEPDRPITATYIASHVDAVRAALSVSDAMLTFEGRPCKVDSTGNITFRKEKYD